jgi:hypothetical protein
MNNQCFYCETYNTCTHPSKSDNVNSLQTCHCFVRAMDICDRCDKPCDIFSEMIHTEDRKSIFVCENCTDELEMDTNQFYRRIL